MKYLKITIAVVVVVAIGYTAFMTFGTYSDGSRSGKLYKFSKKGNVFKTYEGEIQVAGTDGSNFSKGANWTFSVNGSDKDAVSKLEEYSGKEVKLYYKEKYWQLSWNGDTKYFVYKVELIK